MRVAILDLGTNTFHLFIAETGSKGIKTLFRSRRTVKLGEGGFPGGAIGPAAWERGQKVLRDYAARIRKHKPGIVKGYATSAIRSAVNGNAFMREAYRQTGIRIQVISGEREAELIYKGVRACVPDKVGCDLVMDIGGGSVEFIIGDGKNIAWKHSFNTGAARLLNRFHFSDPVTPGEVKRVGRYLEKEWKLLESAVRRFPVNRLIGSSGSFESLSATIGWRTRGKAHHYRYERLDLKEVSRQHTILLKSTRRQRMKMRGLPALRVDMIIPASICTDFIIRKFHIKEMVLSRYALKEGAMFEEVIRNDMAD